jgi:hypothetical protein
VRSAETTFGTVTSLIVTIAALASAAVVYLFMRMNADQANMGTELSGLPDNNRTLQSGTKTRGRRALVAVKFFQT